MRDVIVTADDFGLSAEVNEAVEIAHHDGILTAASLMVGAPAFRDAVRRARTMPRLRVGLHLTLVDGRPVLPASQLPDLVDRTGRFRSDMAAGGAVIFFSPSARRQLAAEVEAQFDAFASTGLALDHVNAHRHFHVHPTIAGTVIAIGHRYDMRAVRVPREPVVALRAIDPMAPVLVPALMAPFTFMLAGRLRRAALKIPDQVFGLAWSGAMTTERLLALSAHIPPGLTEIYMHPATGGAFEGAAPGYRYPEELAALIAPAVREALLGAGVLLGGYADFG